MSDRPAVRIARGAVHLPAALYDRYFPGISAVILLIREGTLQVLPVHHVAAGGCLLKQRNAAGDRVAAAPDLFLAAGLQDLDAADLPARWSSDSGGLIVELPPESAN
ncbi:MAG TPA: hypothetical protein VKN76_00120 [Kiloniellaceae bacterium]|nr:hypothetical protein [Kiloniellaceae bacterium]